MGEVTDSRLDGNILDRVRRLELLGGLTPAGGPARIILDVESIQEAIRYEKETGRLFHRAEVPVPDTKLDDHVVIVTEKS